MEKVGTNEEGIRRDEVEMMRSEGRMLYNK